MKKVLIGFATILSISMAIANDDTKFKEDSILKQLLVRDLILKPYEQDKIIISMAILDAKSSNKYSEEISTILNKQKATSYKPDITPATIEQIEKQHKIKDKQITQYQAEISRLTEKVNTLSLEKDKFQSQLTKYEVDYIQLNKKILDMNNQIVKLSNNEKVKNKSEENLKIKLYDKPHKEYDNNWSLLQKN